MEMAPALQVNALYDTKYRMFTLGGFFGNETIKRSQILLTDGRYLQLDANLRYFYERYQRILAERDADGSWTDSLRGSGYRTDRQIYYDYIERQRDAVIEVLERMAELEVMREEVSKGAREEFKARLLESSSGP